MNTDILRYRNTGIAKDLNTLVFRYACIFRKSAPNDTILCTKCSKLSHQMFRKFAPKPLELSESQNEVKSYK